METTEEVTRKGSADVSCRVTDIWNVLSRGLQAGGAPRVFQGWDGGGGSL